MNFLERQMWNPEVAYWSLQFLKYSVQGIFVIWAWLLSTLSANLLFSFREDMYSQDSIDLLASSGLQFQKHEEEGIDTLHFAELLMTSGVVLSDSVKWLSFHRYVWDGHWCYRVRNLFLIEILLLLLGKSFRCYSLLLWKKLWRWNVISSLSNLCAL